MLRRLVAVLWVLGLHCQGASAEPLMEWKVFKDGAGEWLCENYLKAEWKDRLAPAVVVPCSAIVLSLALFGTCKFGLIHHMSAFLAAWYLFVSLLLGVHCDTYFLWATVAFFVVVVTGLVIWWMKPALAKPGSPLYAFFHRRLAVASVIGSKDYGLGTVNDFANMTWSTATLAMIFLAWIILAVIDRNDFYTTGAWADYDKTMAVGRAFSHGALRLFWLAEASGHRFGIMWGIFGIPYDRMITFHKLSGRLAVTFMTVHGIIMLAKMNDHNYRLDDMFSWNSVNMLYGLLAWIMSLFVVFSALPFMRRRLFEMFYIVHFNCKFAMHVLMILHSPRWVLPFSAGLILSFYFDFSVRFYAKALCSCKLVSASVVADDEQNDVQVARLEFEKLSLEGINKWHAGSYVMIALGDPIKSMVPSGILFHPFTIASPPSSHKAVIMVKNMGKGSGKWSDQVFDMAKSGADVTNVTVRVGPMMGRHEIDPADFSTVVLCCGGIGITPLASILGDIALTHMQKYPKVKRVQLFWSVRSQELVSAFSEWFAWAGNCSSVEWDLHVFVTRPQVMQKTIQHQEPTKQTLMQATQPPSNALHQLQQVSAVVPPSVQSPQYYNDYAALNVPPAVQQPGYAQQFGPGVPMQQMAPPVQQMGGPAMMAPPQNHGPTYFIHGTAFGSEMPNNVQFHEGRPNFSALLEGTVNSCPPGHYVGVYSCGPAALMADVSQACANHPDKVFTHMESFEW